jgi:acetyl-CoA carboxylase carboxyltransferase component
VERPDVSELLALLFDSDGATFPVSGGRGDGVVTVTGLVGGRWVAVWANDPKERAGALSSSGMRRVLRLVEFAVRRRMPLIYLADSSGAMLQEGPASLIAVGEVYRAMVRASRHVPRLAAVLGGCVGGSAFFAASSDVVVGNLSGGYMFVSGPRAAKFYTGEDVDIAGLGGISNLLESGTFQLVGSDGPECLRVLRRVLGYLPSSTEDLPPREVSWSAPPSEHSPVPESEDDPYDVREVIASLVDEGSFLEFEERSGRAAVVGLARMEGSVVGIVANNPSHNRGLIDSRAAEKMARFIGLCDRFNIPLLTLVDTPGFLPSRAEEVSGLPRHGAKLLHAFSTSEVPKVAVILRRAYAGGYVSMCSRGLGADYVMGLPNAIVAVQPPKLAAEILHRKELERADPAERDKLLEAFSAEYERAFRGREALLANGVVDEVVEPRELRRRIVRVLGALTEGYRKQRASGRERPYFVPY